MIAVPETGSFTPGHHDVGVPHPGVHRRRARRHDEPARRVPRRRASSASSRRSPPAPTIFEDIPGHAVHPARVPRAARSCSSSARRACSGSGLMDVVTPPASAAAPRADASAAPAPFRPSAAGWLARGVAVGRGRLPRARLPAEPARHRGARYYATRSATGSSPCRSTCCSATSGQISLGHQAFVGIGAFTSAYLVTVQGQSFWVGVARRGGDRRRARRSSSAACRCASAASTSRSITLSYGLVAEQNIFQIQELTGGGAGPARAEAGLVRHRLALLLPVPRVPRRRAVRRLADDAKQGRAGAARPAREPAGGVDVRHQRAPGHAVRVRRLGRVRRPRPGR